MSYTHRFSFTSFGPEASKLSVDVLEVALYFGSYLFAA
jgi:hypothetical protein